MAEVTELHPAGLDDEALLAQCDTQRRRGSGPGGQHRNKTESAVELVHQPTGVRAQASERRSQHENRRQALRRLRLDLALQVRGRHSPAQPSDLWHQRQQGRTLPINERHRDFPALLAEALDIIAACRDDVAKAARSRGLSTSQLLKLLKKHPPAMQQINQARTQRGSHPYQ
jgi:hypothetical protein